MSKTTVFCYGGEAWAAGRMAGDELTTGKYVAWGTGAGVAAKEDTTLFSEASESRVVGAVSAVGSGATAKYQVEATLVANGTKTITNAGNFTASANGTMIVHGSFDGIDLNANDSVTFSITIDPS